MKETMTDACGCCEGAERLMPQTIPNRPGLDTLAYRTGTQAAFLETMKARLSSLALDIPANEADKHSQPKPDWMYPLRGLTTRAGDDPAIALLDSWATVADVLTFYQERIANEGYLRTATERRSVHKLAWLVGYKLRPGVASTAYLAYTLDETQKEPVTIPAGARVQSAPGPGELPQTFETSESLEARAAWNVLKSRLTKPQYFTMDKVREGPFDLYFKGVGLNLKPSDLLALSFAVNTKPLLYLITVVEPNTSTNCTKVGLTFWGPSEAMAQITANQAGASNGIAPNLGATGKVATNSISLGSIVAALKKPPARHPATPQRLTLSAGSAFSANSDSGLQAMVDLEERLRRLYPVLANRKVMAGANDEPLTRIAVFRVKAAPLFGHNAPLKFVSRTRMYEEWNLESTDSGLSTITLDAVYDQIVPGSFLAIEFSSTVRVLYPVLGVRTVSRAAYGISARVTQLVLKIPDSQSNLPEWFAMAFAPNNTFVAQPNAPQSPKLSLLRGITVYAQPEILAMADDLPPIPSPHKAHIGHGASDPKKIELDALYPGLQSGRWLIVEGERTELPGIMDRELVMLAGVEQTDSGIPGDTTHTTLVLTDDLAFNYQSDTLKVYGNVAKATHGETRTEVVGSGDGSQALQTFTLRQPPLTFVPALTAAGAESTLKLYVNDVRWREADSLNQLGPRDLRFITRTDSNDQTSIIFGNGENGARLPTGQENIRVEYRNGIGKAGNVRTGQLSLLMTRPLGVKNVSNPLPASGGADRENLDQARKNAPLAVTALDRLVSVQDYADFARMFAGIGKAAARQLAHHQRELVHVTIAGADSIPIEETSDLYRNLVEALRRNGDPHLPFRVDLRRLSLLVISANIRISPDYVWEAVYANIRMQLLDAFSFDRRELGQDALLSEAIRTIQNVPGVAYVDVDVFDAVDEAQLLTFLAQEDERDPNDPNQIVEQLNLVLKHRIVAELADIKGDTPQSAQLVFLSSQVPHTLILNRI